MNQQKTSVLEPGSYFPGVVITICTLITLTMCTGCTISSEPKSCSEIADTPSEVLNELKKSQPCQIINLDEIDTEDIEVSNEDVLVDVNQEYKEDLYLGHIADITAVNNRLYFYDRTTEGIYFVTGDEVKGPLTRQGSGPGEHESVTTLTANFEHVFVGDINNGRINKYHPDLTVTGHLQGYTADNMEVNDEKILLQKRIGFSAEDAADHLISVHSTRELQDTVGTLLPRIIPVGYQPGVYNIPDFSVNRKGDIAASYKPLPWIFLYDDSFEHQKTLVFEYSAFEEMDMAEMDFFLPREDGEGYGGEIPIIAYELTERGDIFMIIRATLFHIQATQEQTSYQIVGKYTFSTEGEEILINNLEYSNEEGEWYLHSFEKIFKFAVLE